MGFRHPKKGSYEGLLKIFKSYIDFRFVDLLSLLNGSACSEIKTEF